MERDFYHPHLPPLPPAGEEVNRIPKQDRAKPRVPAYPAEKLRNGMAGGTVMRKKTYTVATYANVSADAA